MGFITYILVAGLALGTQNRYRSLTCVQAAVCSCWLLCQTRSKLILTSGGGKKSFQRNFDNIADLNGNLQLIDFFGIIVFLVAKTTNMTYCNELIKAGWRYHCYYVSFVPQVFPRASGSSGQLGIGVVDHGGPGGPAFTLPRHCQHRPHHHRPFSLFRLQICRVCAGAYFCQHYFFCSIFS